MSEPLSRSAPVPVRRALLSVSDKTGLVEFARALAGYGAELISTGGTAKALIAAGLNVTPVETVTGMPEMMDGRVKTLHPTIHGAILGRRDEPSHMQAMRDHGITPIDLVCVSLYPFEQTIARAGVTRDEAIEQIDIGGPAMIRAAAKNHDSVAVVTDPSQYERVLSDLSAGNGATSFELRLWLAQAAYARTSAYDAAIAAYLAGGEENAAREPFPEGLTLRYERAATLRYGENPHQPAAAYREPGFRGPSVVTGRLLHGKELSYNNLNDAAAALALVEELARLAPGMCAAAVIKHANPCGAALAATTADAVTLALRGDPVAAYGGILAVGGVNAGTLDAAAATLLAPKEVFLEVIVAPDFDPAALEQLRARSVNLRLVEVGPLGDEPAGAQLELRTVPGGLLAQARDVPRVDPSTWTRAAGPAPSPERLLDAAAVWLMAKRLSSNAIAIGGRDEEGARGVRLFGAGAGQMDRVTACRLATEKAGARARGAIAASDAFFPFPDGPKALIEAGVTLIVHPGGSKRDQETFELCDEWGVTCLTTGVRHFRH